MPLLILLPYGDHHQYRLIILSPGVRNEKKAFFVQSCRLKSVTVGVQNNLNSYCRWVLKASILFALTVLSGSRFHSLMPDGPGIKGILPQDGSWKHFECMCLLCLLGGNSFSVASIFTSSLVILKRSPSLAFFLRSSKDSHLRSWMISVTETMLL